MVSKKKKIGGSVVIILLAFYTLLNLFSKAINAVHWFENGFQMQSYHPLTPYLALIGGAIWLVAIKIKGYRIWWAIPGIFGIIFSLVMLYGVVITYGWFF